MPPTYLIFIIDGPVWTSAGMTAGIDLPLAMIEKESGRGRPGLWLGNWSFITGAPVPVAVFGAAGAGAQIRPYPERTGLCEAQSHLEADG